MWRPPTQQRSPPPPPPRDRVRFSGCGDSRIRIVNGWRRFIQPVCYGNTARETIKGIAAAAADVVFALTRRQSPNLGGPVRRRRCGRCFHAGGGDSGKFWRCRAVSSAAAAAHWPLRPFSMPSAPPWWRHSDPSRRSRGDHGRPAAAAICPPRQIPGRHRCSLCHSAL